MPEHLRALIVILALASLVFYLVGKNKVLMDAQQNFKQRRKLWLLLTVTAFVAHSFWIYAVVLTVSLFFARSKANNIPALFYFLLFLLPPATIQIPGFGIVNYLFDLDHIRMLILVLLLPAWTKLKFSPGTLRFGKPLPDKILASYLILIAILTLTRSATFTLAIRNIFYLFIDVYLPYFVFSRSLHTVEDLKDAISSYVIAASVLGAVASFEMIRHWQLYTSVTSVLGVSWGYMGSLAREGMLRAIATTGQPIALGFVMVVSVGFYLFLVKSKIIENRAIGGVLAGGIVAPLSRGPWVGLAVLGATFVVTGKRGLQNFLKLLFGSLLVFVVLLLMPGGKRLLDFLPFLGTVEVGGIDYRRRLIENSIVTIQRNPLFGANDFRKYPEMQELLQGQGIIDITNTYLSVALTQGLFGLFLFCLFFGTLVLAVYRNTRQLSNDEDIHLLGRSLLAILLGMLVILATVSNITVIPVVYWTFAGICVAYASIGKYKY